MTSPGLRVRAFAVRGLVLAVAGAAALIGVGGTAKAMPTCANSAPVREVQHIGGMLSGAAIDRQGRLYVSDLLGGRVLRIDRPGAAPEVIAHVPGAGGLAWARDGRLLVGYPADPSSIVGDLVHRASVGAIDVDSGGFQVVASGLSGANSLAVGPDGAIYATNYLGSTIGRVAPDGRVDPDWAQVPSANGAAISSDGRFLYVTRAFVDPGVTRIPLDHPDAPQTVIRFAGTDQLSGADSLTLDSHDRPVVPAGFAGRIVGTRGDGRYCSLAETPLLFSALVYGKGTTGFSAGRLFRAGYDGSIDEIPSAFDRDAKP